jgi:hypothetical protein
VGAVSPFGWICLGIVLGILIDGLLFDWPFRRRR